MSSPSEPIAAPAASPPIAERTRRPRVLFLNRSYWPDGEATGQLLTELSEDLSARFDVTVVAGLPNTNPSQEPYRVVRTERRNGVRVVRVPHTRFPKGWLPGRSVNFLTFLAAAFVRAAACRRQDVVVVETDPFLLALIGAALRLRHRSRLIVYLQDIHPDVGVAVGRLREGLLTRTLRRMLTGVYKTADRVVVLSRDMCDTLIRAGVHGESIACVPNWIDTELIRPSGARNRFRERSGIGAATFVVMYSGNLGMTQRLDTLLETAERLQTRQEILFAFVGGGAAEAGLRAEAQRRGLTNVRFFPYQPRCELGESLSAADLHVITVHPAALAYLMPSKLYGILAAGRPVLAAVPGDTELADVIRNDDVGFVVPPGDVDALVQTIDDVANRRSELTAVGDRARRLAERRYQRRDVTARFGDLIDDVLAGRTTDAAPVGA